VCDFRKIYHLKEHLMKKKLHKLSLVSFILAILIFAFSFFIFHFITADFTIAQEFQREAGKPVVTMLLSILGVMFLFSGIMSLIVSRIFFSNEKKSD